MSTVKGGLVPLERIESRILLVRRMKVIMDADLAQLYGVPTKRLNEQVNPGGENERLRGAHPLGGMLAATLVSSDQASR
jgi:hypothetical protein